MQSAETGFTRFFHSCRNHSPPSVLKKERFCRKRLQTDGLDIIQRNNITEEEK